MDGNNCGCFRSNCFDWKNCRMVKGDIINRYQLEFILSRSQRAQSLLIASNSGAPLFISQLPSGGTWTRTLHASDINNTTMSSTLTWVRDCARLCRSPHREISRAHYRHQQRWFAIVWSDFINDSIINCNLHSCAPTMWLLCRYSRISHQWKI